jgi:hypothetical protein
MTFIITLLPLSNTLAQDQKKQTVPKKQLEVQRVITPPKIDGILDDDVWQQAPIATNFIQSKPNPGTKAKHPTEVRVLYDDEAIYVGAIMYDVSQDSILMQLGRRDDVGNTDFFGVFLDTYNDQINGFGFMVTPAGVQLDARYSSNGEDFSWNAVWESSARLQGTNWIAEFRIPYSALRFNSKPEQVWGINFMRNRRSTRQEFFWNHVDPAKNGFVNQWGKLVGLQSIEAPLRLSFTPYVSAFGGRYPQQAAAENKTGYKHEVNFGGGMDVKYGISDAFTLDMTLIPDFSQVPSDNQVLNLSPFEVQFNENRPFFLEGTELFNKGGFFYSRRIGERPILYNSAYQNLGKHEVVLENPGVTKMINGTKLSGRTKSGLGIGVFNAVVGRTYATLEDTLTGSRFEKETQPLSNYNIVVLDQSLKNNSYVTFINASVMREGSIYDANLTGLLFRVANKENRYAINGRAALSQQYFKEATNLGHNYEVELGKVSGNFTYNFSHAVESDTYNPNDLSLLRTNNSVEERVNLSYRFFQPFWKLLNLNTRVGARYSRRYKPDQFQNFEAYGRVNGTFSNFWAAGMDFNLEPVVTNDFFEPRVNGWVYAFPANNSVNAWLSTDYRQKLALDVRTGYRRFDENNRKNYNYTISPRYRVNDKLLFVYSFSNNARFDDMGYVTNLKGRKGINDASIVENDSIVFGLRDVDNISNTLNINYTFNNKMDLSVRARHNWSDAVYKNYFNLTREGSLLLSDYRPENYKLQHNRNFNTFNIDVIYSWWFAPGSEISIVWKDAFTEITNQVVPQYLDNLKHTILSPRTNTLSVKVLYFIDYLTIKKHLKGK